MSGSGERDKRHPSSNAQQRKAGAKPKPKASNQRNTPAIAVAVLFLVTVGTSVLLNLLA